MKTKRLVSLLLSVLLASSSLPMAMSAADAPAVDLSEVNVEIGEELLDDGDWAGLGSGHAYVEHNEVAENKYLRINNSTANGAYYRIGETSASNTYAAGTYSLTFKARTQSDEAHVIRMKPNGGSQLFFTDGEKTITLDNDWETFTTQNFTTTAAFKGIEIWGGPDGKYISPVEIDDFVITKYNADGGVEHTWTYDFDTKAAAVFDTALETGVESESSYYAFGHAYTNKDMAVYTPGDEIVLEPGIYQLSGEARMTHFYYQSEHSKYEYTDYDTGAASVAYKGIEHPADCELCAPHKASIGSYTTSNYAEIKSYIKEYKAANNALPTYHMNYLQHSYVDNNHGESGVLAKDVNHENGDGIYHVLYKRIDKGIQNDGNANYRGVAMNLSTSVYNAQTTDWADAVVTNVAFDSNTSAWNEAGGFIEGSDNKILKVTDDWSSFTKTIRVDKYTKLNSIELGGTGYGYDIDPIDFRNVSLKQVDSFVLDADESIDENVTIMDIIEADISSDGQISLGTSPSFASGNNYITAYDRANNNDGIWVAFNDLPEEPEGEEYKVQFDIRAAVPVYKNGYQDMNYRVYSAKANGVQQDALVGTPTPFYHGAWTTVSFNYDANIPYGFRIVGGGAIEAYSRSNTAPVEIDNLRIVDKNGDVVAGYLDTLDTVSFTGESYTTPVATYKKLVQYTAVPAVVKLALDTEEVFYTAKFDSDEGTISYTFEEGTVFKAGKYKFTGELRAAEYIFNSSDTTNTKADYLKYYPDTADYNGKRCYITEDNNAFDYVVTATFVGDDNIEYTKTLSNGSVTTGWGDISTIMRLDEAAEIKSIDIALKHALADTDVADVKLAADYKNFSFHFTPAEEQGEVIVTEFDAAEFTSADAAMTPVTVDHDSEGNNFLFVGDRRNNLSGLKVTLNEYDGAEQVSFKVRLAVPTADKTGAFGVPGGLRIRKAEENVNIPIVSTGKNEATYTDVWTEIVFDLNEIDDNTFIIYGNARLSDPGVVNCAPFELDNLTVLGAGGIEIVTESFDRVSEKNGKLITGVATIEVNDQYKPGDVDLAIYTEESYNRVSFTDAEGTLTNDHIDIKLVPGMYTLTAELRNAEYIAKSSLVNDYPDTVDYLVRYPDSNGEKQAWNDCPNLGNKYGMRVYKDNNGFDVTPLIYVTANGESSAVRLDPVSVGTTWTEVKFSFRLDEEATLDKIELALTHLLGADSNAALSVDVKSIALECKPADDTKGIPNVGIIMVLLAKKAGGTSKLPAKGMTTAIADGTTELGEAVTEFNAANFARPAVTVEVEENNYMTMVGRINNGDGITIKATDLNLDASKSYELKFDLRTSTEITKIGSNPDNLTMSRIWVVSANQNINPSYGPAWTTVTIPYEADKMATGYSVVGGIGATFSHPYDIDNVRIVEKGTDTVVASVDFEDVELQTVAETLSVNGFEFAYRYQYAAAENGKDAKISVEKDTSYAKATVTSTPRKAGSVSYAVEETVLNPGTYTLTLSARNGLYSGANTDLGKSNAVNFIMREPDDNTTKTRQRITANNNYVNLYAEVVTDSAVFTAKASTAKVFCAWTPLEFTFGVTEPVTVKSVNVCASHALLNTELAVTDATINVKDIVIWATDAEVIDIPVDGPETAEVEGNLIVNGDFDTAPTIVEGSTYDASKGNAWFQNDGEQYDTDANGKEMKEQGMIPFNHKITWNDGYITFSGRENNLRQFWFNAGVTAEAGASYKLTLDVKTAKVGEASSIRVGVDGLYNPTATDAVSINNDWKTITVEFTASAEKPVKLFFYGGPGASYTHDFCVDNVVLVKVA